MTLIYCEPCGRGQDHQRYGWHMLRLKLRGNAGSTIDWQASSYSDAMDYRLMGASVHTNARDACTVRTRNQILTQISRSSLAVVSGEARYYRAAC